jgi:hypothetical protein
MSARCQACVQYTEFCQLQTWLMLSSCIEHGQNTTIKAQPTHRRPGETHPVEAFRYFHEGAFRPSQCLLCTLGNLAIASGFSQCPNRQTTGADAAKQQEQQEQRTDCTPQKYNAKRNTNCTTPKVQHNAYSIALNSSGNVFWHNEAAGALFERACDWILSTCACCHRRRRLRYCRGRCYL